MKKIHIIPRGLANNMNGMKENNPPSAQSPISYQL